MSLLGRLVIVDYRSFSGIKFYLNLSRFSLHILAVMFFSYSLCYVLGSLLSFREAEILRRRAQAFLRNSSRLLEEKEWDLAVFCLEQYCQLLLKYKLLVKRGSYPRSHSLRRLIRELGEHAPKVLGLIEDLGKLHYVARLEEAYIASRYLPYEYEEREVKDLYRFVVEVFRPLVEAV